MTTKQAAPATPLPITTSCNEEMRANAEEGRKYRAEQQRMADAYPRLLAERAELVAALTLACRYLEHPDVQAIPFAMNASAPLERARAILRQIEGADRV